MGRLKGHSTPAARGREEFAGWCGKSIPAAPDKNVSTWAGSIRAEAPGYFAMLAFLSAYLLDVAGAGQLIKAALNLAGAAVGAIYLQKKGALPSVISNLVWAAITVAGLIISW